MAKDVLMPLLSPSMTEGTLVKWLKKEGDAVKTGDVLAEVETDKATMELESFFDGVLVAVFVPEGSQVPLGAALCAVGKAGEKVAAPASAPAPAPAAEQAAPAPAAAPTPAPAPAPAPAKAPEPVAVASAPASAPSAPEGRIRIS